MAMIVDKNETVIRAKRLRRSPTLPEGLLWQQLRKRPDGHKFRRQHPLGPYILDFYCAAARLAIEVDGEAHIMGDNPAHDVRRDRWLARQGVRVVRFSAVEVVNDLGAAVQEIIRQVRNQLPLHQASPGPPPQDRVLGRN